MDAWIEKGCPYESDARGRVKGMYLGDVLEWSLASPVHLVRERAAEAAQMHIALVVTQTAFAAGDFEAILVEHGLDEPWG